MKNEIGVSGRSHEMGFLVDNLRKHKIPYRQAFVFRRSPVLLIPEDYRPQLTSLLEQVRSQHSYEIVKPEEIKQGRDMLRIMIFAVIGILVIAWGRLLIRWIH